MEVVINECYGGFSLSRELAILMYMNNQITSEELNPKYFDRQPASFIQITETTAYPHKIKVVYLYTGREINRSNAVLINFIKAYGSEWASGEFAKLKIIKIPDDVGYVIEEYDGYECVAERHRTWS